MGISLTENPETKERQKPAHNHRHKHPVNHRKHREPHSSKTTIIAVGLVIAIIGSVISSSYDKATLTNYTGFAMLMAGISIFVLGIGATANSTLTTRLIEEAPARSRVTKPKMLSPSIWAIGIGIILAIIGSVISGTYAKDTVTNTTGFAMLLTGICISVLSAFGTALGILKIELN